MNEPVEVHFVHPRNSKLLTADISPQCTGSEALQELMNNADGNGAFLEPLPEGEYTLSVRSTQKAITPSMTFAQAGVVDGDSILVTPTMEGAGMTHLHAPSKN
jgi:hypothetical protein